MAKTRGLVIAEALLVLMLGFTADDLGLLRFPGFLLGAGLAVLISIFGGIWHGHRLATRLTGAPEEEIDATLQAWGTWSRLSGVALVVLFLIWLAIFSQGVPPWAL